MNGCLAYALPALRSHLSLIPGGVVHLKSTNVFPKLSHKVYVIKLITKVSEFFHKGEA